MRGFVGALRGPVRTLAIQGPQNRDQRGGGGPGHRPSVQPGFVVPFRLHDPRLVDSGSVGPQGYTASAGPFCSGGVPGSGRAARRFCPASRRRARTGFELRPGKRRGGAGAWHAPGDGRRRSDSERVYMDVTDCGTGIDAKGAKNGCSVRFSQPNPAIMASGCISRGSSWKETRGRWK